MDTTSTRPATRGRARAGRPATLDRILDAGIAVLAEQGVDACSLPRVAERAGLTTGPLYSRFDGHDDLLAALWEARLATVLDRFLDACGGWLAGTATEADPGFVAALDRPTEADRALVELLAGIRRYPYAAEQVRADASTAYTRYLAATAPIAPVLAGYAAATGLGRILLAPLLDRSSRGTAVEVLTILRDLAHTDGPEPVDPGYTVTHALPVVEAGDPVTDGFLNAALRVIARGGYDRASASRIAREAGLSVSRAYAVFTSKQELAARALSAILEEIANRQARFVGVDRESYQGLVLASGRALCDPASLPVRRLQLECVLAGRHHEELRTPLRGAFDGARRELEHRVREAATAPRTPDTSAVEGANAMWHVLRDFGFGVLVLEEAVGVLSDPPPFGPLAVGLPQIYERYVGGARPAASGPVGT